MSEHLNSFFIWTYSLLPIVFIFPLFFYLPKLTSECQFDCALTLSLMFTWLDLHLWCQTCWYFLKNFDLSELPSSFRRSFWCLYRVQDPLSSYIHVLDMNTYIWCNVSCNVWLCMNEMSKHFLNSFFLFIFPCFQHNVECKCLCPNYADEIPWLVLPMWYANIVP